MTELVATWDLGRLILWGAIVILFAIFVFSVAYVQLGLEFSDSDVTKSKRNLISSEVFGNMIYHVVFIGLILVLGVIGYAYIYNKSKEQAVTAEPGEFVS